jgi:2-phosphosulfolactate phosphatase
MIIKKKGQADMHRRSVVIDCFPSDSNYFRQGYAVVCVDVIRATTTACTAVSSGRRCFPVTSVEMALRLRDRVANSLLVGELGGVMPPGFDLNNSPAKLAERADDCRPVILLSSSGTQLMCQSRDCDAAYIGCFRNYQALARCLSSEHEKVAIIGAGTRGEFREEDQMCCAWIAEILCDAGYSPEDHGTADLVKSWSGLPLRAFCNGKSAEYLRKSGQLYDLEFILSHVDDVDSAYMLEAEEIVASKSKAVLSETPAD